jgi:stage III sporulation protein AD
MDIIKLIIAFLGVAFIIFLVRKTKDEFALPVSIAAAIVFFGVIVTIFEPIYDVLVEISSFGNSGYVSIMLKSLTIAGATRLCAEICRDLGENAVASKIEVFGKLGMVTLSLPLLKSILEIIQRLV